MKPFTENLEDKIVLAFTILVLILLFSLYPAYFSIMDEQSYLSTAFALKRGSFYLDNAGIHNAISRIRIGNHLVSKYPPGNSLLLVPFTSIHWKLGFLRNILFFLLGFLIFLKILKILKVNKLWSLLYLLHPTIIIYSRTLMSDIPSMFLSIAGFYLLLKKRPIFGGLILGFNVFVRYTNILIPIGLALGLLFHKKIKDTVKMSIGVIVFLCLLLLYNHLIWGDVLLPFRTTGSNTFSLRYLKSSGLYYLISMNILYPLLLLISILFSMKKKMIDVFSIIFLFLVVYSFYYYIDRGDNPIASLVIGQRFMLPVLPFMFIPYTSWIEIKSRLRFLILIPGTLLFIFDTGMVLLHQKLLKNQLKVANIVMEKAEDADLLIVSKEASELLNPFEYKGNWIFIGEANSKYLEKYEKILVVLKYPLSEGEQRILDKIESKYTLIGIHSSNRPIKFSIYKLLTTH